jgi:hypothetical protein
MQSSTREIVLPPADTVAMLCLGFLKKAGNFTDQPIANDRGSLSTVSTTNSRWT